MTVLPDLYIAALICGSLFIDRNLLPRATVEASAGGGGSLFYGNSAFRNYGIILGEGFWGGILYIGVPMTSGGGMTAGTVPLSAMYSPGARRKRRMLTKDGTGHSAWKLCSGLFLAVF